MKFFRIITQDFTKAVLAGALIGIACIANISVGGGILGAVLFCVGLLVIVHSKLFLYTGMIGKVVYDPKAKESDKKPSLKKLLITLLGNGVGTFLMTLVLKSSRLNVLLPKAEEIASAKLSDTWVSIFILSVFCGVLVYFAVYKFERKNVTDLFVLLFCVTVFVIIGFEHSIASSFYLFISLSWKSFGYFLIMVLGNSLGSMLVAWVVKERKIKGKNNRD